MFPPGTGWLTAPAWSSSSRSFCAAMSPCMSGSQVASARATMELGFCGVGPVCPPPLTPRVRAATPLSKTSRPSPGCAAQELTSRLREAQFARRVDRRDEQASQHVLQGIGRAALTGGGAGRGGMCFSQGLDRNSRSMLSALGSPGLVTYRKADVELLDYWRVARRNWFVLVASTLVGLGLAAAYSLTQPTVYSATSSAYVVAGTSESTADALAGSTLAKQKAEIYLPLVTSQQVATRIADELGRTSAQGIAASLTGSVVEESVLFQITATSSTAASASQLAEAAIRATAAEVEALETINPSGSTTPTTVIKVVPVQQAATPAVRVSPTVMRKGFLPLATTRGDRLFIGLLAAAYVNLIFVGISGKLAQWLSLENDPSIWISFVLSMALLAFILRKG